MSPKGNGGGSQQGSDNSARMQGLSHDCLHHECVKV